MALHLPPPPPSDRAPNHTRHTCALVLSGGALAPSLLPASLRAVSALSRTCVHPSLYFTLNPYSRPSPSLSPPVSPLYLSLLLLLAPPPPPSRESVHRPVCRRRQLVAAQVPFPATGSHRHRPPAPHSRLGQPITCRLILVCAFLSSCCMYPVPYRASYFCLKLQESVHPSRAAAAGRRLPSIGLLLDPPSGPPPPWLPFWFPFTIPIYMSILAAHAQRLSHPTTTTTTTATRQSHRSITHVTSQRLSAWSGRAVGLGSESDAGGGGQALAYCILNICMYIGLLLSTATSNHATYIHVPHIHAYNVCAIMCYLWQLRSIDRDHPPITTTTYHLSPPRARQARTAGGRADPSQSAPVDRIRHRVASRGEGGGLGASLFCFCF